MIVAPATEPAAALSRTEWQILSPGDLPIRGDLRVRVGSDPRRIVVICHGFKGFRNWGFFPPLARALAMRGFAVVSFDFTRNGVGADGVDFSDLDGFAMNTHSRNVAEIERVLHALVAGRIGGLEPRRIGLLGHSRGGGEAVLATGAGGAVDALVTWAAIADIPSRWSADQITAWRSGETVLMANARTGQQMPMGPAFWRDVEENAAALDIPAAAARVTAPWLIVHGERDTSVLPTDAERLFAAAGSDAELLLVEGADHTFGAVHPYTGATPELRIAHGATADWFDAHLR